MRLPAYLLVLLKLAIIPLLITTVQVELASGRPQDISDAEKHAVYNRVEQCGAWWRSFSLDLEVEAEFPSDYDGNSSRADDVWSNSKLCHAEKGRIESVLLCILILAVPSAFLWYLVEPRLCTSKYSLSDLGLRVILRRHMRKANNTTGNDSSSDESNTESISESGLDFASSSEYYEESEKEEKETRETWMSEVMEEAIRRTRLESLAKRVTELEKTGKEMEQRLWLTQLCLAFCCSYCASSIYDTVKAEFQRVSGN